MMEMNIGMLENFQKVLEYKDWRNFRKVIDKAVLSANNSVLSKAD